MEWEYYMSERYHSGGPRQEGTGGIFVLVRKDCGFLERVVGPREMIFLNMSALWAAAGQLHQWPATAQVIAPQ